MGRLPSLDSGDAPGVLGFALACAGAWSWWGWEAAALGVGVPLLVLYFARQAVAVWASLKGE